MMRPVLALFAVISSLCQPAAAQERVTVFAAASLRNVLEEAAELPAFDGLSLRFSFGGSGTMARQVAAGAPADAVLLASTDWMGWLQDQGVVAATEVAVVASNRLVLIAPSGTPQLAHLEALPQRLGTGRLAIGHRNAVPGGVYARQWLENAGLWERVVAQLAETDNVRAALALVAQGHAPFGVVYASDALAEPRVDIIWEVSRDTHDPILYLAAALTPAGQKFVSALQGPDISAAFSRHGFAPVPE